MPDRDKHDWTSPSWSRPTSNFFSPLGNSASPDFCGAVWKHSHVEILVAVGEFNAPYLQGAVWKRSLVKVFFPSEYSTRPAFTVPSESVVKSNFLVPVG